MAFSSQGLSMAENLSTSWVRLGERTWKSNVQGITEEGGKVERMGGVRDPTHQLLVHVLHVCRLLLTSELHPLCTVCTTIAPRVLHFSAVHLELISNSSVESINSNSLPSPS